MSNADNLAESRDGRFDKVQALYDALHNLFTPEQLTDFYSCTAPRAKDAVKAEEASETDANETEDKPGSIAELVHEWRVSRAKLPLDLLLLGDKRSDEQTDFICAVARGRQREIEDTLGEMRPEDGDEIHELLFLCRALLEDRDINEYEMDAVSSILSCVSLAVTHLLDPRFEDAWIEHEDGRRELRPRRYDH